jgi:hypothetical protein
LVLIFQTLTGGAEGHYRCEKQRGTSHGGLSPDFSSQEDRHSCLSNVSGCFGTGRNACPVF